MIGWGKEWLKRGSLVQWTYPQEVEESSLKSLAKEGDTKDVQELRVKLNYSQTTLKRRNLKQLKQKQKQSINKLTRW